jgi:branched-chain amino acid transport system permease protein
MVNLQTLYDLLDLMCIYGISAVAQNLLVGYSGIPAVAPTGFGACGGYLAAYLALHAGWPTLLSLVVGVIAACAVGFVMSVLAMRLSVEYIILITIAFAVIVIDVFSNFGPFGGSVGLVGLPPLSIGVTLGTTSSMLPVLVVVLVLTYLLIRMLGESSFGILLRAIREDQVAARAIGMRTVPAKVAAFVVAAGFAGLAGGLLVFMEAVANPTSFGFTQGILVIAMLIIGGLGRPLGPVIGAIVVTAVPQILRDAVNVSATQASLLQEIIFGVVLVLIMLFRPRGILPERPSGLLRRMGARAAAAASQPATLAVGDVAGDLAAVAAAEESRAPQPMLTAASLVKRFGGIQATAGFSFDVGRGEIVGLVGPNGAGKTTLFNLVSGAIRPDGGRVTFLGQEVTGLAMEDLVARGLARSFQDVRLFTALTVLENTTLAALPARSAGFWRTLLLYGKARRETQDAVETAYGVLTRLGLADKAQLLAGDLSFGEQKLVAIARAVSTGTTMLLLDEPTAGVGAEFGRKLRDVIGRLHADGTTIVLIEHNLEVVRDLATRILYMEAGSVRAEGTFTDLVNDPVLAESYFGSTHSTPPPPGPLEGAAEGSR